MVTLHAKKNAKKIEYKIDRQLNTLFDSMRVAKICMLDRAGHIIGWNSGAERLTGYSNKEVLGKNYSMFISAEERRAGILQKALMKTAKTGEFATQGIRIKKDGSHFWAQSHFTTIKDIRGHIEFFVVMTRDISERKMEEQRREEHIGIASHELKNPITTLSLYSELLAKRLDLDSDKKNLEMLRDIQGQAARLVRLVDDLLIVGKLEGGTLQLQKEAFDRHTFITKIIRDFQNSNSTHKIIYRGNPGAKVRADKDNIGQVLINLLTNAVKYSPRATKVLVGVRTRKNKCIISIQDFGSGISKEDQRNIFTRYFRSKAAAAGNIAGSGLGLYISRQIIQKHRERIWVKSVEGKGTTFSFTLSLSQ